MSNSKQQTNSPKESNQKVSDTNKKPAKDDKSKKKS